MATKGKRKRNNIINLFVEVRLPGNTYTEKRSSLGKNPKKYHHSIKQDREKSYTRENKKATHRKIRRIYSYKSQGKRVL